MPNTKVVGIIFPYILTPIPNLYDHSFPRYGQITFLTFRRPTTLTFDLKFWKYLSVTVYPYVIIGQIQAGYTKKWMAEFVSGVDQENVLLGQHVVQAWTPLDSYGTSWGEIVRTRPLFSGCEKMLTGVHACQKVWYYYLWVVPPN